MGVTGLWKLIEQSGTPVPLDTLENKVLAVGNLNLNSDYLISINYEIHISTFTKTTDVSIWLHQAVKGYQDSSGAGLPNAHLLGLYHRICKLLYYRIKPVFVFDGGIPYLKRETMVFSIFICIYFMLNTFFFAEETDGNEDHVSHRS